MAVSIATLCLSLACANPKSSEAPVFTEPAPEGALEIHLEFGTEADLDLFVTDPRSETVYFGNNPSLGGGVLDRDVRCDSAAPRRETVRFTAPSPGRYRVGVSYDRACRFRRLDAGFRVEIRGPGIGLEVEGEIVPLDFQPVVLEFEVTDEAPRASSEHDLTM